MRYCTTICMFLIHKDVPLFFNILSKYTPEKPEVHAALRYKKEIKWKALQNKWMSFIYFYDKWKIKNMVMIECNNLVWFLF